jgi:RNA recognition motif-containing protein
MNMGPGSRQNNIVIPDELAPPNPTLFVSGIPSDTAEDTMVSVFEAFPGFKEVRLVPGKADIAFVDYVSEVESSVAKDALHNSVFPGSTQRIKVTFRK